MASITAASSQPLPAASASVLWTSDPSVARRFGRSASRDFCPAARYVGTSAASPAACARRDAEHRPLAAVIVVYAKCFC